LNELALEADQVHRLRKRDQRETTIRPFGWTVTDGFFGRP
jgi:hypothetical protein